MFWDLKTGKKQKKYVEMVWGFQSQKKKNRKKKEEERPKAHGPDTAAIARAAAASTHGPPALLGGRCGDFALRWWQQQLISPAIARRLALAQFLSL